MKTRRAKALKWWKTMSEDQKRVLARLHVPNMSFVGVDKSSSMIERIFVNVYAEEISMEIHQDIRDAEVGRAINQIAL